MKEKILVLFVTGIMVLSLFTSAFAFGGQGPNDRPPKEKDMFEQMAKKLELTEVQKQKFQSVMKQERELLKPETEKMKSLKKQLMDEMKKDQPDRNKLYGFIKEMGAIRTQIEIKRMDTMLMLRQDLTPAQRKKFEEMGPKDGKRPKKGQKTQ